MRVVTTGWPAGPFFHAKAGLGNPETSGDPAGSLGHRVTRPDGTVEGVFAEWAWDGRRLTVTNDRYGFCPLFYMANEREVAVAPSLAGLLALGARPELDHDALAVFLRLGFFVGEDTCFMSIRALPPGARLEWSPGKFRIESRRPTVEPRPIARRAAIDGFVPLFRDAISHRLPGEDYVLPLSGGRDSRHILLELARQGAPPRLCVSGRKFPPDRGADARVAGVLAGAMGVPHELVGRPSSRFQAEMAANAVAQLCTVGGDGAWAVPLASFLRAHTRTTYDGIAGDALSQGHFLPLARAHPFRPDRLTELADRLLAEGRTDAYLPSLLSPGQLSAVGRDRAVARLAAELSQHTNAAFPMASFFFWNRTRRALTMAPHALFAGVPTVHTPYLGHDVFDYLTSIPEPVLIDGTFHTETIRRAYPRYAGIPFFDAAPPRHGLRFLLHRLRYMGDLLAHATFKEPSWWHDGHGLLPRLLDFPRPSALRSLNRLMPIATYLLQLENIAGMGAPGAVPSRRGRLGQDGGT